VNTAAKHALQTIQRCIDADRVAMTRHFRVRLVERGLLWVDVIGALHEPVSVKGDGFDDAGRSRWIVQGPAATGQRVGVVCAIGRDNTGDLAVFITAFWED